MVKENSTGKIVAAKVLKEVPDNKEKRDSLSNEITILSMLDHPAIMKFIGYSLHDFDGNQRPVIITEYLVNGDLYKILINERNNMTTEIWNDTYKLIIIFGIASSILYLHSFGIIHLDIKPMNID